MDTQITTPPPPLQNIPPSYMDDSSLMALPGLALARLGAPKNNELVSFISKAGAPAGAGGDVSTWYPGYDELSIPRVPYAAAAATPN